MSKAAVLDASRPDFDRVIQDIVDYVHDYDVTQSAEAMETSNSGLGGVCSSRFQSRPAWLRMCWTVDAANPT